MNSPELAFRERFRLDPAEPPLLFFTLGGGNPALSTTVSAQVIALLRERIEEYSKEMKPGTVPRCLVFGSREELNMFSASTGLPPRRAVLVFDDACKRSCVRILFSGVSREFPAWCNGNAQFGAMVNRRLANEGAMIRVVRCLMDNFVRNFARNVRATGWPFGDPPPIKVRRGITTYLAKRGQHSSSRASFATV